MLQLVPSVWSTSRQNAAAFRPASLFSGYSGDWWTATDLTKLFKDQAGTSAVTAAGDTVGCWVGSVNGNRLVQDTDTTSLKPIYRTGGYVQPDGVDDFLVCTGLSLTGYPLTLAAVFHDLDGPVIGQGTLSINAAAGEYRYLQVNTTAGGITDRGSTTNAGSTGQASPGTSNKQSAWGIFTTAGGGSSFRYVEGTVQSLAISNTHSVASKVLFGKYRDTSGGPAGGQIRELLVINRELSLSDRNNLRTYWGAA